MSVYSSCMFMYLHRATCQSSATLTEGFPCFFLSCKANARVKIRKDGAQPALFQQFLCCSMYCLFCVVLCMVYVYCTTATGWQPNCSLTSMSTQVTVVFYVPTVAHSTVCSTCPVQRPSIFYYFKHLAPRTCGMTLLRVCLYKKNWLLTPKKFGQCHWTCRTAISLQKHIFSHVQKVY